MVLLGLRFFVAAMPKRAQTGIYAGKKIMFGHYETFSGKKNKRRWNPNVHNKKYYSEVLGKTVQYKFTTHAMRCIDKAGGFDNYILNTKDSKLVSNAAIRLKSLMLQIKKKREAGKSEDLIKDEVYRPRKPHPHKAIVRTYTDRFYYDWKGPRKQVVYC